MPTRRNAAAARKHHTEQQPRPHVRPRSPRPPDEYGKGAAHSTPHVSVAWSASATWCRRCVVRDRRGSQTGRDPVGGDRHHRQRHTVSTMPKISTLRGAMVWVASVGATCASSTGQCRGRCSSLKTFAAPAARAPPTTTTSTATTRAAASGPGTWSGPCDEQQLDDARFGQGHVRPDLAGAADLGGRCRAMRPRPRMTTARPTAGP